MIGSPTNFAHDVELPGSSGPKVGFLSTPRPR